MEYQFVHSSDLLLNIRFIATYGTFVNPKQGYRMWHLLWQHCLTLIKITRWANEMQNYFTNISVIVICFVCLKFIMILNNMINIDTTGLYSAANSAHKIIGRFIIILILNRKCKPIDEFVVQMSRQDSLESFDFIAWSNLAEQITVRIAQIMIQATDLAQILYGVTIKEKNAGHAKFQYGRHFPRWPP